MEIGGLLASRRAALRDIGREIRRWNAAVSFVVRDAGRLGVTAEHWPSCYRAAGFTLGWNPSGRTRRFRRRVLFIERRLAISDRSGAFPGPRSIRSGESSQTG